MAKKLKRKVFDFIVTDLDVVPILTEEQIIDIFDVSRKDIAKCLSNGNNADNYWYPGLEFDEQTTENIAFLFRKKFLDIEITCKSDYRYLEIFLSTEERHIFKYSVWQYFDELLKESINE